MDGYGKELPFNIIPSNNLFEAVTAFTENPKNQVHGKMIRFTHGKN
jgi:hypothetical protein